MSVQAELIGNRVKNFIELRIGFVCREAEELGLATEDVCPGKVLPNQESCIDIYEIFFIFVVGIAEKALLNKAPKS